ncbi:hypothetical protein A1359_19970 [Methylomonas lenta]|uniref:DUF5710 domain-containing protein n=1 Tax=Methylomonas lenta TaxID=980561 RepID=A0A177NSV0_9GAMM|nr:DUF5710 domain-containing protein [Methylomonas lenta]OAI20981.1 hypothetical protein A1359_19970 [Methylomonas lenta]
MAEKKTYLNVPFAQKDAAKALGARWDASIKKWYVPTGKDIGLFTQWQPDAGQLNSTLSTEITVSNTANSGTFTHPTINDFTAYCGQEPPWD